uniref:DEAD (Asp-Glu-Ala-Asp) box polypeptide 28 n=1 Tax=Eptatretus burgeri TaxID=7764 RepID=A0A8C4NGG9_EPTBU
MFLIQNVGRKLVCLVTSFWCSHPRICSACCGCQNPRRGSVTTSGLESTEKEDPVIRVPYWMQRKLDQLNVHNIRRYDLIFEASNDKLLIQARSPNLNQHSSKQYRKLDYPPLVSKGWKRKKYSGDHFTIKKTKEVQTIPHVMKGSHVLCAAETGCGKTLCYMLPLIQRLDEDESNIETEIQNPRAIVMVPSRELLDQVTNIARSLARGTHLKVLSIGGGRGMVSCICPVPTRRVPYESARSEGAQLILTGATFPKGLDNLLSKVMDVNALLELLKNCPEQQKTGTLVFCNKASTVNWLGYVLEEKKIPHSRLHGSMSSEFHTGSFNILVSTDTSSRGVDTPQVSRVINYEFPPSLSDYIHRTGRVGRVGCLTSGSVVSFVSCKWEVKLVQKIERERQTETETETEIQKESERQTDRDRHSDTEGD